MITWRRALLLAAAGFVGGLATAGRWQRPRRHGIDVEDAFRYDPAEIARLDDRRNVDDVAAAMRRHPAGKRIAR